jgi:cytoskeleton protein RodZ
MQLAMRRQQFNWTVEQVASQLNLAPRQIHAMETDNYDALPGMAVARGFIRSYAKLLKLDSAPLLAQIAREPSTADEAIPLRRAIPTTTFTPHRAAVRGRQRGPGKLILAGGIVVLAAAAAALLVSQRDKLSQLMPSSISARLGAAASSGETASASQPDRVLDTDVAPPLTQSQARPVVTAPAGMTPELSAPAAAPAATAPMVSAAPAATPAAVAPVSSNSLVLNLKQDSWIEVKRADNSTVVARVMRAGSSETFDLSAPLSLTVGNVRGVEAKVRGEPLNLAAGTRNNVARVTVK